MHRRFETSVLQITHLLLGDTSTLGLITVTPPHWAPSPLILRRSREPNSSICPPDTLIDDHFPIVEDHILYLWRLFTLFRGKKCESTLLNPEEPADATLKRNFYLLPSGFDWHSWRFLSFLLRSWISETWSERIKTDADKYNFFCKKTSVENIFENRFETQVHILKDQQTKECTFPFSLRNASPSSDSSTDLDLHSLNKEWLGFKTCQEPSKLR